MNTSMSARLENYLVTYRKRAGFTQDEVAFLLGSQSGAKVSRYERRVRRPNLETVFAYEALFGVPARELFAGLFEKVEKEALDRAQQLIQSLATVEANRVMTRKLTALRALAGAAITGPTKTT
jgi:transcriptional regulator with XRE-family HTH domain